MKGTEGDMGLLGVTVSALGVTVAVLWVTWGVLVGDMEVTGV